MCVCVCDNHVYQLLLIVNIERVCMRDAAAAFGKTETFPDSKFTGPIWAHLGPTRPRWAPCGTREPCYLGWLIWFNLNSSGTQWVREGHTPLGEYGWTKWRDMLVSDDSQLPWPWGSEHLCWPMWILDWDAFEKLREGRFSGLDEYIEHLGIHYG